VCRIVWERSCGALGLRSEQMMVLHFEPASPRQVTLVGSLDRDAGDRG
jgi:hypothetical protein